MPFSLLRFFCRWICLPLLCGAVLQAHAAIPETVRACGDQNEFRPYTFLVRGQASQADTFAGFNADYLKTIFSASGRKVDVTLLPWKRCLALAARGKFDLVLDAAKTPERVKDLYFPKAHYSITPILLYMKSHTVVAPKTRAELASLKRCEILGWDYSGAGVPNGSEAASRPATVASALGKLRAGRCEVMVYDLELLEGLRQHVSESELEGVEYYLMPWMPSYDLHLGVSKAIPYAGDLLEVLNSGQAKLDKSGESARLLRRYLNP